MAEDNITYMEILDKIESNKEKLKTNNISFKIKKKINGKISKLKDIFPLPYLDENADILVYQIDYDGTSYVFKIYTAEPNDSYFTVIIMEEQKYFNTVFQDSSFKVKKLLDDNDLFPINFDYLDHTFYSYIKYKIETNDLSTFKIDNKGKLHLGSEILPESEEYFDIIYFIDEFEDEENTKKNKDKIQEYLFLYQDEYIVKITSLNKSLTVSIMTKEDYLDIDLNKLSKIIKDNEKKLTQTITIVKTNFNSSSRLTTLDVIKDYFSNNEYEIKKQNEEELILTRTQKKGNKKYEYKYKIELKSINDYNYYEVYNITIQLSISDYDDKDFKELLKTINDAIATMKQSNKSEISKNYTSNSSIIEDIFNHYKTNNDTIEKYESNELIIKDNKQNCRIIIKENEVSNKITYNIKIFNLQQLTQAIRVPIAELQPVPKRKIQLNPLPPIVRRIGGSKRQLKQYE